MTLDPTESFVTECTLNAEFHALCRCRLVSRRQARRLQPINEGKPDFPSETLFDVHDEPLCDTCLEKFSRFLAIKDCLMLITLLSVNQ